MMGTNRVYTYHAGQRVELNKRPDEFVVRALPQRAMAAGLPSAEKVSSASSRVRVNPADLESSMAKSRAVAPTHHAYEVAETGEEFLVTDRIMLRFKEALSPERIAEFAGQYGLLEKARYSDREYLFQLTDHTGMNPLKLVVELQEKDDRVETAEHDLNHRARRAIDVPTDASYNRQWHLHTRYLNADFDPRASARCEAAWELLGHRGSADVVVGVTDDGCRIDHPDFNSTGKFAGWGYFEGTRLVRRGDPSADQARMYESGSDHGTACCGVVAAEVDANLTVGAAPGCRLLPIKWESDGPSLFISDSKLRTALDYLADKVDVISNSWGGVPTNVFASQVVSRITELARTGGRRGRGIVFLWAAGNENCPIEHQANQDVPYDHGWAFVGGAPAWEGVSTARTFRNNLVGTAGLMHVAALSSRGQRSHYSNYGTGISICAPSSNSHAYYRLPVRGLSITSTSGDATLVDLAFGGTSSATPLVAGIAALVISANSNLTAVEVVSILKQTASKALDLAPYARTPAATYDPTPTWDVSPIAPFNQGEFKNIGNPDGTWSPWFGHGRVDAATAVADARARLGGTAQIVRQLSNPERPIPDNDPNGIEDTIQIARPGARIREARVILDISHTWIGDLNIWLTAPDGTRVAVWGRQGSDGDDIKRTFTSADVPGLAALRDKTASGAWNIKIEDAASADTGILKSWGLELEVTAGPIAVTDANSALIPDNNAAGITRTLQVPNGTRLGEIAVSVDITHPWIGDLRVELVPPGRPAIVLHDRAGGSGDNILTVWRSSDSAALGALRGIDASGAWQLKVADLEQRDVGKLNRWGLEIR